VTIQFLRRSTLCFLISGLCLSPRLARGQAWDYPLFQQSHIVDREFELGFAGAGSAGTSFLFQWREGVSSFGQFTFDGGVAGAMPRGHVVGFLGAQYAYQLTRSSADFPFELLGVGGLDYAFGNGETYFRIPLGVSIGHDFRLGSKGIAITPFVNPRISLDVCNICGTRQRGRSEIGVGSDIGANLDLSSHLSVRAAAGFGGSGVISRESTYGMAIAWRPGALTPLSH